MNVSNSKTHSGFPYHLINPNSITNFLEIWEEFDDKIDWGIEAVLASLETDSFDEEEV